MTIDEVMQIAKECEYSVHDPEAYYRCRLKLLNAIRSLVNEEREACAKLCEERSAVQFPQSAQGFGYLFSHEWNAARCAEKMCAGAIRARSKT